VQLSYLGTSLTLLLLNTYKNDLNPLFLILNIPFDDSFTILYRLILEIQLGYSDLMPMAQDLRRNPQTDKKIGIIAIHSSTLPLILVNYNVIRSNEISSSNCLHTIFTGFQRFRAYYHYVLCTR
jgi:hypothetical protein